MAIQVLCDICGNESGRWYFITIHPAVKYEYQNVADMWDNCGNRLVCPKCFDAIQFEIEQIKAKRG